MLQEIRITNFKSIQSASIDLGRFNVFIGENGSGKTNVLEALAMVAASKSGELNNESLNNRGVRITKPSLTFSSFLGIKPKDKISIDLEFNGDKNEISSSVFSCNSQEDIHAKWIDNKNESINKKTEDLTEKLLNAYKRLAKEIDFELKGNEFSKLDSIEKDTERLMSCIDNLVKNNKIENNTNYVVALKQLIDLYKVKNGISEIIEETKKTTSQINDKWKELSNFVIYDINTQALRGISNISKKSPLGINGEGLDVLLAKFKAEEWEKLNEYTYLISWLEEILINEDDSLKFDGHKLGRSISKLYFRDKFMRKNNNLFSAENSNEGALHVLFYLSLFMSNKTPEIFAIDNIETALNPRLCRILAKSLAQLSKATDKQALITTHNPAILDGLNLNDPDQRLFVVKRDDSGKTKIERIERKPSSSNTKLMLSEMWMKGYLGGIPKLF